MTETSTQLERRAERTRERLSDHLQELQHNVSPATILSDIFDLNPRKWGADDAAKLLIDQVKTNPVACMLIAAGIGLLVYSDRNVRWTKQSASKTRRLQRRGVARRKRSARR